MKLTIRELLIIAAKRGKPITYSEVAQKAGLDLERIDQRNRLSHLLGDISREEHQKGYPLLSSIVTYKDKSDHGTGFYQLCEELGLGDKKSLKDNYFGIEEMKKTFAFWKDKKTQVAKHPIAMFSEDDLAFFSKIFKDGDKDLKSHDATTKSRIKNLFQKTNYWAKKTAEGIINYKEDNRWQINGYLKNYSWAKLFDIKHKNKGIFFTLSIADNNTLIYKLDCSRSGYRKDSLSSAQVERFDYLLINEGVKWKHIKAEELKYLDWDDLIRITRKFVLENLSLYYDAVAYVWNDQKNKQSSGLSKTEAPSPTEIKKKKSYAHTRKNRSSNTDYLDQHAHHMNIGTKGEDLVIEYEKKKLLEAGLTNEADKVEKMPDGAGYDIRSYDLNGADLFIEVKSTLGDKPSPFFISANEYDFFKTKSEHARIYRVFDLKPKEGEGTFFILTWEDLANYSCEATTFKISI